MLSLLSKVCLGLQGNRRFGLRLLSLPVKEYQVVLKQDQTDSNQDRTESVLEKIFERAALESSQDGIDWEKSMQVIKKTEEVLPPDKPTEEDLLKIRASRPTATLASLVNESKTLQKLVDLGVDLYKWEQKKEIGLAVKLDFTRDVAPLIQFLADLGLPHNKIGNVLTNCPQLLEIPLETLKVRISYLVSKKLTKDNITKIIICSSSWLNFTVKEIDGRLGFLQKIFGLSGNQVREVLLHVPNLVTWHKLVQDVTKKKFVLEEEMGFSKDEIKEILLRDPLFFLTQNNNTLLMQFDLLHNQVGFPHNILVKFPTSIRRFPVLTLGRHKFLVHLGIAQYKPEIPNYVSPSMLADMTDEEFCNSVAKCDLDLYYKFLKTI